MGGGGQHAGFEGAPPGNRPDSRRRAALADFVGFLQDRGALPRALRYSYEQQERLQKCAFIAQEGFGLDLGYRHYLHAYGTFSTELAVDFSEMARNGAPTGENPLPPRFMADEFASLVSGRSIDWLCVASAAVHEMGSCEPCSLAPHIGRITGGYGGRLVRQVVRDLGASLPRARGGRARGRGAWRSTISCLRQAWPLGQLRRPW